MLPFGVTIPATVPQGSEIPEGLMNNPVDGRITVRWIFRKWDGKAWTGLIWLGTGTGSCNMVINPGIP